MAIQWRQWMRWMGGGIWNPEKGIQRAGPDGFSNSALQPINDDRALQLAAVFRCIRIIGETCASLPMRTFRRTPSGDGVPLEDSHWLNALVEEPNDTQTGDELRESIYGQMAGWGNAYAQKVPNDAGRTVELWPYKVANMDVRRLEDRSLAYRYPDTRGIPQDLPPDRVLHFRAFCLDGVMGLSPLGVARQALGLAVGAQEYASSFFAQGGRPSGVLTSDKLLTDKQREQVHAEFGGLAEGKTDKRLWVLESALKYTPVSVSPEDMQMIQTQAFSIAEIARFFGVPLFLLMETEKSTSWGSGIEQQNIGFLTYTLRPYLQRMVAVMNRWVIPPKERRDVYVAIDETPLLLMDSTGWQNFAGAMATQGIMTRNELRKMRKLPRIDEPNADKLTVQTALTPIANLGKVPPNAQPNVTGGIQ
jgi:HK97 family phage portal protein